jgi:hypothetical protein
MIARQDLRAADSSAIYLTCQDGSYNEYGRDDALEDV